MYYCDEDQLSSKELNDLARSVLNSSETIGSGLPKEFCGGTSPINLDGAILFGMPE